jgi:hypothetical protein
VDRIVTLLVTLAVAFMAALAWDRRPEVVLRLPIPILHPKFRIAAGPVAAALADRDRAQVELARARQSGQILEAALVGQNAAIGAMKAAGDQRTAEALTGLRRALEGQQAADAKVARLLQPGTAVGLCARYQEADAAVLGSLR